MKKTYPVRLPLLDGLRWQGHLTINARDAEGFAVAFDAKDPKGDYERFIFDRTVLTAKQLREWTGVDPEALP